MLHILWHNYYTLRKSIKEMHVFALKAGAKFGAKLKQIFLIPYFFFGRCNKKRCGCKSKANWNDFITTKNGTF